MTTRSDYRSYKAGTWEHYLVEIFPARLDWTRDHRGAPAQMHSCRRDTEGRFNDLDGEGKPTNERFLRKISGTPWQRVAEAVESARAIDAAAVQVLEWAQKRYKAQSRYELAEALGVDPSHVSRLLRRAIEIVKQELDARPAEKEV